LITSEQVPADQTVISPAPAVRHLTEDHAWIAEDLNTVIAHQLFSAGLDLHVALGLIGDNRAVGAIHHAIGGLDRAIRELHGTAYGLGAP
jgi:hypothetical protein